MSDTDRDHLVDNIVGHASDEVTTEMQERVVAYWSSVDAEPGRAGRARARRQHARGPLRALARIVAEHANRA